MNIYIIRDVTYFTFPCVTILTERCFVENVQRKKLFGIVMSFNQGWVVVQP